MIVNRLKEMRTCRLLVVFATASAVGTSGPLARAATPPSKPQRAAAAAADRAPGEESLSERRAVRGVPVDDAGTPETPELRELRRFEEQAFPKSGAPTPPAADGALPTPSLPGSWGGSGDVPPELRSPAPPPGSNATPARSSCPTSRCVGTRRCFVTSTTSRTIPRDAR